MLKKDYLSLFYNLLFLSIHTCTLQHTHKSSRFHQSKGRLSGESLNVLLANSSMKVNVKEEHTRLPIMKDWLQVINMYISTSHPFYQVLYQLLEIFLCFFSWGSSTAFTAFPNSIACVPMYLPTKLQQPVYNY